MDLITALAIESAPGHGGLKLALDEVGATSRPWCFFQDPEESDAQPYLLGMPELYEKIIWIRAPQKEIPRLVQLTLAAGLFDGVLILGLEKLSQIPVWSKRWLLELKLASTRGFDTRLVWLYSKPKELLPHFNIRVRFTGLDQKEILKGHFYYEQNQRKPKHANDHQTERSA